MLPRLERALLSSRTKGGFAPPGLDLLPLLYLLLISRNHYDHLDAPTVRALDRDTPVPSRRARPVIPLPRFTAVTELDWWKPVIVGAST